MSDNSPSSGGTGDTIASDDIAGIKFQRLKLIHGADGVNAGDVSSANGLPVSQTMQTASGSLTAVGQAVTFTLIGESSASFQLVGLGGGNVVIFEASNNAWVTAIPIYGFRSGDSFISTQATTDSIYRCTVASFGAVRVRCTSSNGNAITVTANTSANPSVTLLGGQLPTGSNVIGSVVLKDNTGQGAQVFDDALNTAVQSQSVNSDSRSSNDILDTMSEFYLPGTSVMLGSLEQPIKQDPVSSGLIMLPTTRVYKGGISAAQGFTCVAPCDDMISITGTALALTGASGGSSVQVECFYPNQGWVVPFGSYSFGGGNGQGISAAQGVTVSGLSAFVQFSVTLNGATFVRVKMPTITGTWFVTTQLAPVSAAAQAGFQTVSGANAEAVAVVSNPVPSGAKARSTLTTFSAGQTVTSTANLSGSTIVDLHCVPELSWSYAAPASGLVNTTTAVTIKAAVASQRGNISSIQIQSEPLGAATEFAIRDGAAGTVLWRIKYPVTTQIQPVIIKFDTPLRQAAVSTLLEIVTLTASVTGAIYFNAQGFMSA